VTKPKKRVTATAPNFLVFNAGLLYNALTETFNQHIYPLPPEASNDFFRWSLALNPKPKKKS
jgi:hypothetical protein